MKIVSYIVAVLMLAGAVSAAVGSISDECQAHGFDSGVAKWSCGDSGFTLEESNYISYTTDVVGDCQGADWTSVPGADGLVVKAGTDSQVFPGGVSGTVEAWSQCQNAECKKNVTRDISHVTFCRNSDGGSCRGQECDPGQGVPEFSTLTLGVAVLAATMGLVYLRKR